MRIIFEKRWCETWRYPFAESLEWTTEPVNPTEVAEGQIVTGISSYSLTAAEKETATLTMLNGSSLIPQVGYVLKLLPTLYLMGYNLLLTPVILVTQLADQLQVIRLPCRSVVSKDVMKWFMRQVIYVKSSQHFLFFSQNESSPVNASDLSDVLTCLIPDDVSTSGEVWWWTRFLCSCKQKFSTFYRRTTYCWKGYGFDDDRAYMIRIYLWILELSKSHLFSNSRKHNNSKGILALWRFEQILR